MITRGHGPYRPGAGQVIHRTSGNYPPTGTSQPGTAHRAAFKGPRDGSGTLDATRILNGKPHHICTHVTIRHNEPTDPHARQHHQDGYGTGVIRRTPRNTSAPKPGMDRASVPHGGGHDMRLLSHHARWYRAFRRRAVSRGDPRDETVSEPPGRVNRPARPARGPNRTNPTIHVPRCACCVACQTAFFEHRTECMLRMRIIRVCVSACHGDFSNMFEHVS
jgi:hypothetical protein